MSQITLSQFTSRFVTLVLKGNGLPRKQEDRHILMLSAILHLEAERKYSEKELNEQLRIWSDSFGDRVCLDHVSLRRQLVDDKYLVRDAAGQIYRVRRDALPYTVDPEIWTLDLQKLVDDAVREQEERRRLHQQNPGV